MCAKKREIFTNDYPPVVIEPLRSLGIVQETAPTKKSGMIRKLIAMMIYAILFALVLYLLMTLQNLKRYDYSISFMVSGRLVRFLSH